MITFHRDHLAPPELCRLLALTVPEEYNVPVIFFNRPHPEDPTVLGRRLESHIEICLNPIFNSASRWYPGSFSTALWRLLLEVCYHEFGHVATDDELSFEEYARDRRAYHLSETLAIQWARRRVLELRDHDPRLAQPSVIRGYFGARLAKCTPDPWKYDIADRCSFLYEWRCRLTGGQLAPGDALRTLGIEPKDAPSAYAVLRRISGEIGIDYVDRSGRAHKLYTWGDIPRLGKRLSFVKNQHQRGRESVR